MFKPSPALKKVLKKYGTDVVVYPDGLLITEEVIVRLPGSHQTAEVRVAHVCPATITLRDYQEQELPLHSIRFFHSAKALLDGLDSIRVAPVYGDKMTKTAKKLPHTEYRQLLDRVALAAEEAVGALTVPQLRQPLPQDAQELLFATIQAREDRANPRQVLYFLRRALCAARIERAGMSKDEAKRVDTYKAKDGSAPLLKRLPSVIIKLTDEEAAFIEKYRDEIGSKTALFKKELHRLMRQRGLAPRKPRKWTRAEKEE